CLTPGGPPQTITGSAAGAGWGRAAGSSRASNRQPATARKDFFNRIPCNLLSPISEISSHSYATYTKNRDKKGIICMKFVATIPHFGQIAVSYQRQLSKCQGRRICLMGIPQMKA